MAEGWLRHLAGDRYKVFSAGVTPSHVHPLSIRVMQEFGIDISGQHSDDVHDYLDQGIDILITVCDHAAAVCPAFSGKLQRIHWSIPDPFQNWADDVSKLPDYRRTRDELKTRIENFLATQ